MWVLRFAVGLPVLAVLVWVQIGRLRSNGFSASTNVLLAVCSIGAVLLAFAMVALIRALPAINLRVRLSQEGTARAVFVARTTGQQLQMLRLGRSVKLNAYFVVVASEDEVQIWSPNSDKQPYARQSWASIDAITEDVVKLTRNSYARAIEIRVAEAEIPALTLIPSQDQVPFLAAGKSKVRRIVDSLESLRSEALRNHR